MVQVLASVLNKEKDLSTLHREIEAPGSHEVQVAPRVTTLCGSDMHYFNHGRNGDFKVREPLSLGHEAGGEVVAVGSQVKHLKVGDRVALEVGLPCGECSLCRRGRYNLCSDMKFRSSAKTFPHLQGTLQTRINCPESWCYRLPDNVSYEEAALVEPLSVAVHAGNRAQMPVGASVLIFGAGAVGLFSAAIAKINGATNIVIADIAASRVNFATSNGLANKGFTVPLKRGATTEEKLAIAKETAEELVNLQSGKLFDYTFECTGVESCVQAAIYSTAPGGKVMFVGMGQPVQTLHMAAAMLREVDLLGVFRYANTYPTAINMISSGKVTAIDKIITHRVSGLTNAIDAFNLAGRSEDDKGNLVIKVAVVNEE